MQSAGAILGRRLDEAGLWPDEGGALYRNGYLEKLSGGRDKMWKLSDEADKARDSIREQREEVKVYGS